MRIAFFMVRRFRWKSVVGCREFRLVTVGSSSDSHDERRVGGRGIRCLPPVHLVKALPRLDERKFLLRKETSAQWSLWSTLVHVGPYRSILVHFVGGSSKDECDLQVRRSRPIPLAILCEREKNAGREPVSDVWLVVLAFCRGCTLGDSLVDALDVLVTEGKIDGPLAGRVMEAYDEVMAVRVDVRNTVRFRPRCTRR